MVDIMDVCKSLSKYQYWNSNEKSKDVQICSWSS